MSPEKAISDLNKLRKQLISDTHWTLDQVDNTDYYELCELFSKKQSQAEAMPLADFLKTIHHR